MNALGDSSNEIPLGDFRRFDELCDEIEQLIQRGEGVDLSAFLGRVEARLRERLIEEVLAMYGEHSPSEVDGTPVETLVRRNPELRVEIEQAAKNSLGNQETEHFEPVANNQAPLPPTPRRKKSRGLRIRCPHCSNHVELIGDTSFDSVSCTVCGSTFSLVDRSTETRMAEALQKIDRFELVSRIGVGGFGTVWKARDTELDRAVAVKIPRYGQLTPAEIEQFFREARSVAQLRHPNIVPVHEVGREGDAVFIVSDFIRGVSLADLLTGKRHSPREAAELCITIAKALDHAHRKGVIHRDLKPSNVMIDGDGTPFLMDFGLAKREAEEVTMTVEGQIVGTPAYMSPEQAGGQSAWADRRTDVYSLGVMLFELLTGDLPFRGNAQMQVHQRLNEDAPNVRSLNRHLPKDLATICAKCLEREPGSRYQTAKHVADELTRYLEQKPILARPLSVPAQFVRWAARRPWQAALLGMTIFLAIAGPTAALTFSRQKSMIASALTEKANLVQEREKQVRDAKTDIERLTRQLTVWEGMADESQMWPRDERDAPKRQQLSSLWAVRKAELREGSAAERPLNRARRLLALAILCEHLDDLPQAELALVDAKELLRQIRQSDSSVSIALAEADCLERLAAIVDRKTGPLGGAETAESQRSREQMRDLLKQARDLRRRVANEHPEDPLLQAFRLDAELRTNLAVGFKAAGDDLLAARDLSQQLATLWPTSTDEIYRLACLLAGRQSYLSELPAESKPPVDHEQRSSVTEAAPAASPGVTDSTD